LKLYTLRQEQATKTYKKASESSWKNLAN